MIQHAVLMGTFRAENMSSLRVRTTGDINAFEMSVLVSFSSAQFARLRDDKTVEDRRNVVSRAGEKQCLETLGSRQQSVNL
jgi:hypothetical protein